MNILKRMNMSQPYKGSGALMNMLYMEKPNVGHLHLT